MEPQWLRWAKRLQAASQNGLAYNTDPYNVERYTAIGRIAAEIMATYTETDVDLLLDLFAGEAGHATPKVDVRGVVLQDGRILLVRERSEGLWSLPGGWADVYDSPSEATEREVFEESGYRVRASKLLALYDRAKHAHPPMPYHVYKVFFQCELLGGQPTLSAETDDVGFFAEDGLPRLSVARVTAKQLTRFFAHARHPEWPADFD
jgi:ADP-ribose pyrophosphatase YjhB (NUDIX family)